MAKHYPHHRVLSVVPVSRGFGFAVLEARGFLVAWGFARLSSRDRETFLVRLESLVNAHRPRILCVESAADVHPNRRRSRARIDAAFRYASTRRLRAVVVTLAAIEAALGVTSNVAKHAIATRATELFPELEEYLPDKRRLWDPEDDRIWMLKAVAVAAVVVQSHA